MAKETLERASEQANASRRVVVVVMSESEIC